MKSYAKINLGLDITGASGGYHTLDSVVVTVDLADVIAVKKRKKDKLVSIAMHGRGSESIPFDDNNAVKAANAFISRYDTCGVDITVWKNIPVGAGLGGSSADVSGTLRALKRLFEIDDESGVKEIADSLGSDCGYMLYGGYARLFGRGEEVQLLDSDLSLDIGILVPSGGVSTAQCYKIRRARVEFSRLESGGCHCRAFGRQAGAGTRSSQRFVRARKCSQSRRFDSV